MKKENKSPRAKNPRRKAKADSALGADPTLFDGFTIRIDTREQCPFEFVNIPQDEKEGGGVWARASTVLGTMTTADYSIEGFHQPGMIGVAVERKSKQDLYGTISQGRERFERELERLAHYRYAMIVVESELSDVLGNPPPHTKFSPKIVARSVISWQTRHPGIQWVFLPGRTVAMQYVFRYLMRANRAIHEDVFEAYPGLDSKRWNWSSEELATVLEMI